LLRSKWAAKAGAFAYAPGRELVGQQPAHLLFHLSQGFSGLIGQNQRLVVYLSDRFLRFGLRFPEKLEQTAFSGSKQLKTPF
jgi:hypothetical protein